MYVDFGLMVGNAWRQSADGSTLEVRSPADGQLVGRIPRATRTDLEDILVSSEEGFDNWRNVSARDRGVILRRIGESMVGAKERFAALVSAETGKPLREAESETVAAAEQFLWYAEEAPRIYGYTIPARTPDVRMYVNYEPIGVCLALSAWNFPVLLPARKVAAALAAGCAVILKPSSETPGAAFLMAEIAIAAGLPPGAFNVVTGDSNLIGEVLMSSAVVRKVSLTGSAAVGRNVLARCAEKIIKVSMELGGHAPAIVHKDADPVQAARALATAKFRNCGQVCISPSRFYVHETIREPFEEAFAAYARGLRVGDGRDPNVDVGPMVNRRGLEHAIRLTQDALDRGARLLAGGGPVEELKDGYFFAPTVFGEVPEDAAVMREEPFAPIAPIAGFDDPQQAVARANALPYGLAAYVFTRDSARAYATSEALEAGMVGINEVLLATAEAPFGGVKASGFGREGGALGIYDYLTPKYVKHRLLGDS